MRDVVECYDCRLQYYPNYMVLYAVLLLLDGSAGIQLCVFSALNSVCSVSGAMLRLFCANCNFKYNDYI